MGISDPASTSEKSTPVLLAPMATMLRDRTGHLSLATGSMRSLLDSVASRLEEQRETTRYLVGLLIFLGLLGTFWGLLQTVSSVGSTIGALDTNAGENTLLFDQLKEGLAGPLKGMGTAFSCSMRSMGALHRPPSPHCPRSPCCAGCGRGTSSGMRQDQAAGTRYDSGRRRAVAPATASSPLTTARLASGPRPAPAGPAIWFT